MIKLKQKTLSLNYKNSSILSNTWVLMKRPFGKIRKKRQSYNLVTWLIKKLDIPFQTNKFYTYQEQARME